LRILETHPIEDVEEFTMLPPGDHNSVISGV
jgi:hypothetical protein